MGTKAFRLLFTILAATSFIAVLLPQSWHACIKGAVVTFTSPAQSSAEHVKAGGSNIISVWRRLLGSESTSELDETREEVRRLRELLIIERSKIREKEVLIEGLGAFDKFAREHYGEILEVVPARVIGRDATRREGIIVIDRGRTDGVRTGSGVVWGRSAVGIVTETGENASLVNILASPRCKIPAYIQRTGESTLVEGGLAGNLRMRHVFRSEVKAGDICLTSGELGIFPRDIIIGEVIHAEKKPGELFQEIVIRPQLNLSALQAVVVLMREKGEFR